jgi:hypothetical protein
VSGLVYHGRPDFVELFVVGMLDSEPVGNVVNSSSGFGLVEVSIVVGIELSEPFGGHSFEGFVGVEELGSFVGLVGEFIVFGNDSDDNSDGMSEFVEVDDSVFSGDDSVALFEFFFGNSRDFKDSGEFVNGFSGFGFVEVSVVVSVKSVEFFLSFLVKFFAVQESGQFVRSLGTDLRSDSIRNFIKGFSFNCRRGGSKVGVFLEEKISTRSEVSTCNYCKDEENV